MKLILLITLFATLVRLYFFLDLPDACCGSDQGLYHFTALNVALHDKFVITQKDEPRLWKSEIYAVKPPLYPFFIAGIYKFIEPNYKIVVIIQILLSSVTGLFIYLIGKELASKKVGLVALIIYSFFLEIIYFDVTLLSENIYWLLLSVYIYLLIRMKVYASNFGILIGIVSGMLILLRPPSLSFILPISVWYLWKNLSFRTIANIATMFLFSFLVVLPWNIRNYQIYGQPIFIYTDGGINMWMGNHQGSTGGYNIPKANDPNQTPVLETQGPKQEIERDNFYYNKSKEYILSNPLGAFDLSIVKTFKTFSLYRRGEIFTISSANRINPLRPVAQSFNSLLEFIADYQYILLIILFVLGLYYFYIKKQFSAPLILIVILIVSHLVSIALTHYEFRYIMQLYPLMIPLAAVALAVLGKTWNIAIQKKFNLLRFTR